MTEPEQLALIPAEPPPLKPRQQTILTAIQRAGHDGLSQDEAGAEWCAAKGIHATATRCDHCAHIRDVLDLPPRQPGPQQSPAPGSPPRQPIQQTIRGDQPVCRVRFVWPIQDDRRQTVRLEVTPLPPRKGGYGKGATITAEQRERQAWRGLAHYLEGTLKAATFGLIRFEDIFLSFMEISPTDQRRIGDVVVPQIRAGQLALGRGDA